MIKVKKESSNLDIRCFLFYNKKIKKIDSNFPLYLYQVLTCMRHVLLHKTHARRPFAKAFKVPQKTKRIRQGYSCL